MSVKLNNPAPVDIKELETRVQLIELRAREVEAEVRLMEAMAKRRALKTRRIGGRGKKKHGGSGTPKADA